MPQSHTEIDEIRVSIERLRSMLENLIVRGLRACGRDELAQLQSYAEDLDRSGAGHVSSVLNELRQQIERNDRSAGRTLLSAQTSVRLLERLLTLRVTGGMMHAAVAAGTISDEPNAAIEDEETGA